MTTESIETLAAWIMATAHDGPFHVAGDAIEQKLRERDAAIAAKARDDVAEWKNSVIDEVKAERDAMRAVLEGAARDGVLWAHNFLVSLDKAKVFPPLETPLTTAQHVNNARQRDLIRAGELEAIARRMREEWK